MLRLLGTLRFYGLICFAVGIGGHLFARETGTKGATFLKLGEGPRAVAMGEAQAAVADDAYASFWNPAGLAYLKASEVAMTYQRSIQDVQEQQATVGLSFHKRFAVGAYMNRFSVSSFDGFDASGNPAGQVDASDAAYGLAYAARPSRFFSVGGTIKFIRSQLGPATASSHALDLGLLFKLGHGLSMGLTSKDIGPALVYDAAKTRLPQTTRLGFGYEAPFGPNHLTTAFDYAMSSDGNNYFALGQEFWIQKILALRAGYRTGQSEGSGLRFGLGIGIKNLQFGYSFSPFGFLGDAHRFGFSYRFGPSTNAPVLTNSDIKPLVIEPIAAPPVAVGPGPDPLQTPAMAIPATPVSVSLIPASAIPLKGANDIPQLEPPTASHGLLNEKKESPKRKVKEPVREHSSTAKSQTPAAAMPSPADIPALLTSGNDRLKEGRFEEATTIFSRVLKIEPNNKAALDLMRKTLNELDRKKKREKGIYE